MSEEIAPYHRLPTERQKQNPELYQVRFAIMRVAAAGLPFTADEVQGALALAGEHITQPNTFGAAVQSLAKTGYIRKSGVKESNRKPRHGGLVRIWVATGKPFDFEAELAKFKDMAETGQLIFKF